MAKLTRCFSILVVLLLAGSAVPAMAQGTSGIAYKGWGVRVGASGSPDQFFGGVHFDMGEFAKNLRFRPTVELGFGDHETVLQGLAEVHYVFNKVQVWKPYVGGGMGFAYANVDKDVDRDAGGTKFSFGIMGGVGTKLKSGNGFYFEGKFGLGDNDPDFKAGVGWTF